MVENDTVVFVVGQKKAVFDEKIVIVVRIVADGDFFADYVVAIASDPAATRI